MINDLISERLGHASEIERLARNLGALLRHHLCDHPIANRLKRGQCLGLRERLARHLDALLRHHLLDDPIPRYLSLDHLARNLGALLRHHLGDHPIANRFERRQCLGRRLSRRRRWTSLWSAKLWRRLRGSGGGRRGGFPMLWGRAHRRSLWRRRLLPWRFRPVRRR